jgi:hypothetical protein
LYLTYPVFYSAQRRIQCTAEDTVRSGGYGAQRRIWISISSAAEDMDFHILRCALYPPLRTGAGSRPGEGGQEQVESRQAEEPDTASAGQVRVRTEQEQGGSQGAAAGQQGEGGGEGTELPESGDTGAAGGRGHGAAGGRGHGAAGGGDRSCRGRGHELYKVKGTELQNMAPGTSAASRYIT